MDTTSKVAQLRAYELTYLVSGGYTDQDVEKIKADVQALLKKYQADVIKAEDWGKKALAYTITHEGKKNNEAYYMFVSFNMPTSQAQDFERQIFLQSKIMRHLLLVAEDAGEATEKAAE